MMEPRGPVFVSIPSDDWDVPCEPLESRQVSHHSLADTAGLSTLARHLNQATRPAFVVGDAVDRSDAWDEIVALAERHQANVYVAPMSARCSFPEDHRLWNGFLSARRESVVAALAPHDVVLVIGAPVFTYHVPGSGPAITPGTRVLHITEDPSMSAGAIVGTSVHGHVKSALAELNRLSAPREDREPLTRVPTPRVAKPVDGVQMPVSWVLQEITDHLPHDGVIVEEAPSARPTMHHHLPIHRKNGFYTMSSGGLGYGLPAAVGISLARPEQRVIGLIGDGSAMYASQALWTAAQLALPLAILILRNGRYGALDEFARVFNYGPGEAVVGSDLPGIDFVGLAKAHGVSAIAARTPAELKAALRQAFDCTAPILVEIEIA